MVLEGLIDNTTWNATAIGVGFGTAALGSRCHEVVLLALKAGFRKFDTAEENQWWYNQKAVGTALREFFSFGATENKNANDYDNIITDDECVIMVDEDEDGNGGEPICGGASAPTMTKSCVDLRIPTTASKAIQAERKSNKGGGSSHRVCHPFQQAGA